MSFVITPTFVGLCALAQVPLTFMVGLRRLKTGIRFLGGDDEVLVRRMRAHGNWTETVPITILAMACAEWTGLASAALWIGGIMLLVGRAMHTAEILRSGWGIGRSGGMVLTFIPMAGFGLWCLSRTALPF